MLQLSPVTLRSVFNVHTTYSYWDLITTVKHPIMQGKELEIKETLQSPDEVRRSRIDAERYLFYKSTDLNQFFMCCSEKRNK